MQRQREEKETLEANVREQVVSEMMEVISDMQNGFRYVCLLILNNTDQAAVFFLFTCLSSFHLSVKEIPF